MSRKVIKKLGLWVGLMILSGSPAYAVEKRCGWIDNPTPANWFLTDRNNTWTISAQGGYQAKGMDKIPDITTGQFIKTNGNYGYACGCMNVTTDKRKKRIIQIQSFTQLKLNQCRTDRSLPPR